MGALETHFLKLWNEASAVWSSGGWAMFAIAAIALVMFGLGVKVNIELRAKGFQAVPEKLWRLWIDDPGQREGPIGRILDKVTSALSLREMGQAFEALHATETVPFERDLKVMKTCVSAAPLVGLLGTVTGMLATFGALSSGSGGDQTMGMIASGISEALVTTETGLVVALPGLFFQYLLARKHEQYKAFLTHVETVCTKRLYKNLRRQGALTRTTAA